MKKTIIFGTLLFTLLSCADTETKDSQKEENKKTSVLLPLVRSAKVKNTSFNHKISIQGNIETTKDILINFLLVALAIDFPKDVLPTPGGPTKHKIGPFIF